MPHRATNGASATKPTTVKSSPVTMVDASWEESACGGRNVLLMTDPDDSKLPGEDAQPLPADARARWDAFTSAIGELATAADDPEGIQAAARAMWQISRGLDGRQFADALEIPEDAGEYAEALRRMLVRIPDGWGRWIRCERGWYPLLAELDADLAALLPRYEIYQVKEKFGGLRLYWNSGERVLDSNDPEPPAPRDDATAAEKARAVAEQIAWQRRLEVYLATPKGRARHDDLQRRVKLATEFVEKATARAAKTCERCGEPGECCRGTTSGWYRTLCAACAATMDYVPVPDDDDDD